MQSQNLDILGFTSRISNPRDNERREYNTEDFCAQILKPRKIFILVMSGNTHTNELYALGLKLLDAAEGVVELFISSVKNDVQTRGTC